LWSSSKCKESCGDKEIPKLYFRHHLPSQSGATFDLLAIPAMSDNNYFDDTLDSEFLDQVDALETQQPPETHVSALDMSPPTQPKSFDTTNDASSARARAPSRRDSDSFEEVFDLDDLEEIDNALARGISGPSKPPVVPARTVSKALQTTLWSGMVSESLTKGGDTCRTQPTGERTRKVKTWDKTAFAKSGRRAIRPTPKADAKAKGKGKVNVDEEGREGVLLLDAADIPDCTSSEPSKLLLIFL